MKLFARNALLGAAGLVALSLSANAAGAAVADAPLFKSNTEIVKHMQVSWVVVVRPRILYGVGPRRVVVFRKRR